jgi:hypothetical protein
MPVIEKHDEEEEEEDSIEGVDIEAVGDDETSSHQHDDFGDDDAGVMAGGGGRAAAIEEDDAGLLVGDDKGCTTGFVQERLAREQLPCGIVKNDSKEGDDCLGRKQVEAIDRAEAAISPTLQRQVGVTRTTPGAFRSIPCRGVRRIDGRIRSSSLTSLGDSVMSPRGGGGGFPPPPIEAVLVLDSHNNHGDDSDDDDSMAVFTAEPLASVQKVVSTRYRYILLGLAVLCMVTITTSATAVILVTQLQDKKKTYVTHHAAIFGSHMDDCFIPPAVDDDAMKIEIWCDRDDAIIRVYADQCQSTSGGGGGISTNHVSCIVPYSSVSYVSFDCVTPEPLEPSSEDQRTSARVVLPKRPLMVANNTTCNNSSHQRSFAFARLVRICGPDKTILTTNECVGDKVRNIQSQRGGGCVTVFDNNEASLAYDEGDVGLFDCSDCIRVPAVSLDRSNCPAEEEEQPEWTTQDYASLGPSLSEIATAIQMFLQNRRGDDFLE